MRILQSCPSKPWVALAALGLLISTPVHAQSNATADLMTYGDVLGGQVTAVASGVSPNTTTYIVPSFKNTGSNFLVGRSGDANDFLTIDIDLAAQGTLFVGNSNGQGVYQKTFSLPNQASLLDRKVFWQGFTAHGGSGVNAFQDFTNLRTMTINNSGRWQDTCENMPLPSANLGWDAMNFGLNGEPVDLFICGGGPALLTDTGVPYNTVENAWMYDGVRDEFQLLNGTLNTSRAFHTVTRLNDGTFLVTGGVTFGGSTSPPHFTRVLNSAELYDPTTDTFTSLPNMSEFRAAHTATLLPDGKVLVAGGTEGNSNNELFDVVDILTSSLRTTEIYDPTTMTWSNGPNMFEPKAGANAVQLQNGRVLIMGGITFRVIIIPIPSFSDEATIYNPFNNTFGPAIGMVTPRALFGAQLLDNGDVLIVGGTSGDVFNVAPTDKCELFTPGTNTFGATQDLPAATAFIGVTLLDNGLAMAAGGADGDLTDPLPRKSAYTYDPNSGTWTSLPDMAVTHGGGVVEALEDGTVVVAGGESDNGAATRRTESYTP